MSRVLLCLSHAIEEHDQLRLLTGLGHEVASLGGYIDPAHPHVNLRPPLPHVPFFPEVKAAVDALGVEDNIGAAQAHIPEAILEWLGNDGVIFFHHYLDQRLVPQWPRLLDWKRGAPGRRVVWRSVGQSVEHNERLMAPLRAEGLERVAYSPREANIPGYSGHDALIRFYADPAEFGPWIGDIPAVINVTQHLKDRDPYTNFGFWQEATRGLPAIAMGPGSETHGGTGSLSYPEMLSMLRRARAYLYLGTQPASYTLGLIEAMMSGVPTLSISANYMRVFDYGHALFEGEEIALRASDDRPETYADILRGWLGNADLAAESSAWVRARAIELFGMDKIAAEWRAFLA